MLKRRILFAAIVSISAASLEAHPRRRSTSMLREIETFLAQHLGRKAGN